MSAAVFHVINETATGTPDEDTEDHEGAARFIIATVLVYSLMGVFGMLLLRIKRSASRAQRSMTTREESVLKYIKNTDRLMLQARRDVMRRETERISERLNLCQTNSGSGASSSSNKSKNIRLPSTSTPTSLSLVMPSTPNSLSLVMPLLSTVPETSDDSLSLTPRVVFHFPTLNPLALSETQLTFPSSPTNNSTPVTLVTAPDGLPGIQLSQHSGSSTSTFPNCHKCHAKTCLDSNVDNALTQLEKCLSFETNNNQKLICDRMKSSRDSKHSRREHEDENIERETHNVQVEVVEESSV